MAYNPNIPLATDQLSQSQSDIEGNFQAIQTLIDVNHVDFSDGADMGKHWVINLPVQTGLPGSQFAAGEVGLYNQLPTAQPTTGVNELWINKQNSGGVVQIPLTASILSTNGSPASFSNGWTYLPSGILLKWGNQNMPSGSSTATSMGQTVVYPTSASIPVFNRVFQILLSNIYTDSASNGGANLFNVYSSTATQFQVTWAGTNASNTAVSYLSIGY